MTPAIGNLCAGYGGLDLALGLLGPARTAWVADIEPGPRTVLAHRHPDAPNIGDVISVTWGHVEPVDIIADWATMDGEPPTSTDELGTPDMLASLTAGRLL